MSKYDDGYDDWEGSCCRGGGTKTCTTCPLPGFWACLPRKYRSRAGFFNFLAIFLLVTDLLMIAFYFSRIGEVMGTWFNTTALFWCSIVKLCLDFIGLGLIWYLCPTPMYDIKEAMTWTPEEKCKAFHFTSVKANHLSYLWKNAAIHLTVLILVGPMLGRQKNGFIAQDPMLPPILYEPELQFVALFATVLVSLDFWTAPGEAAFHSFVQIFMAPGSLTEDQRRPAETSNFNGKAMTSSLQMSTLNAPSIDGDSSFGRLMTNV